MRSGRVGLVVNFGIDQAADGRHAIGGDAGSARMFPNGFFIGREVHAVDLVFGDVAVEPLNLRPHIFQGFQRGERDVANLRLRHGAGTRDFALNYKLRHSRYSLHQ